MMKAFSSSNINHSLQRVKARYHRKDSCLPPEDKTKYEKQLSSTQEHIKQFIDTGVKDLKEIKEVD